MTKGYFAILDCCKQHFMSFKNLTFTIFFLLGFCTQAQVGVGNDMLTIRISENASEEQLQYFISKAKEQEITLSFEEVQRSSAGKISSLALNFSDKKGRAGSFRFSDAEGIDAVILKIEKDGEICFLTGEQASSLGSPKRLVLSSNKAGYTEKPLFVIDGKIQAPDFEVEYLDPQKVEKINVLKEKAAVEKYGDKAKAGAIEISMKKS